MEPSLSFLSCQTTRKPLGFRVTTTMNADEHMIRGFAHESRYSFIRFQHEEASS